MFPLIATICKRYNKKYGKGYGFKLKITNMRTPKIDGTIRG
ncbi:MAG: hypothetical protein WA061_02485 [Microgenomates group bacterium]